MGDKYLMDQHKLIWHLDRVSDWMEGKHIVPLHIDFGITTGCNMTCKYCYGIIQARKNAKKRFDMPKEAILRFLKDAKEAGVRSIAFIGEGENTLNPHLYDALKYAKEINLDVSLATNGIELKKERIKEMLESLKWIRFNISAATPLSYNRIHNVPESAFEGVRENIKACVEAKKKYGINVTIGLQMVLLNDNIEDLVSLAELGKELGVDYLVVKPCSDTPDKRLKGPTKEYLKVKDILKKAESYSDKNYTVSIKWSKLQNLGKKDYDVCYGTQFILGISGNGNVFPCGHWFAIRSEEFIMGNIINSSFKDIIESERYWEVQKKVQKIDVNRECETNCRQHYVNEFLWGLKNKPVHVNFI